MNSNLTIYSSTLYFILVNRKQTAGFPRFQENVAPPTTPFGFQPIRSVPQKTAIPAQSKPLSAPVQSSGDSHSIEVQQKALPTDPAYVRYAALQTGVLKTDADNRRSIDPLNYSISEPVGSSTAFLGSLIQNRAAINQLASGDTCLLKTLGLLSDESPSTKSSEENSSASTKPKPITEQCAVQQRSHTAQSASRQSSGVASEMYASLQSLSLGSSANTSTNPSSTARPTRNDEARTKRVSILPQLTTVPEELSSASGSGAAASSASASLTSHISPRESNVPHSESATTAGAFFRSSLPPGQQKCGEITAPTPGSAFAGPMSRSSLLNAKSNSHSAI